MIIDMSSDIRPANTKLLSALFEKFKPIKSFYVGSILCIAVLHNFHVVQVIIWLDILYIFFACTY